MKTIQILAGFLLLIVVTVLVDFPMVRPERAALSSGEPEPFTLVGCWAHEEASGYALVEYRPDGTYKGEVQPKKLLAKLWYGKIGITGNWWKTLPDDAATLSEIALPVTPEETDLVIRYTLHDVTVDLADELPKSGVEIIRFDGPNTFVTLRNNWQWNRVDKRL